MSEIKVSIGLVSSKAGRESLFHASRSFWWFAGTRLPGPQDSPGKNTGVGCHCLLQCMKVKSDSPPDSSVYGILQARILECVAMPSSRGSSQPRD